MTSRWPTIQLCEVAEVIRGVTFDKSEAHDKFFDGSIPILRAGNIGDGLKTDDDLIWVPRHRVSPEQMLRPGDIVIAMSSGSAKVVGKTAELLRPWNGSAGAFCAIVRFTRQVIPRLGAYWFQGPAFLAWSLAQCQGANIKNLRKSELEAVQLPCPPPPDQERIVSILDAADELRRLRSEADRRTADLIPAIFHEMFGDPSTNPNDWELAPVSSFVAQLQGGKSIEADGADNATGYRILKVSAVTWRNFQPTESKPVPLDYFPPQSHFVRAGDLLFSRANTSKLVGATSFVFETPNNLILPDKIWRFVWFDPQRVEPLYVWGLFQHPSIRLELGRRSTGTSGSMKNIAKPKVMSLRVPLPSLSLQRTYATRVSEARELESKQAESRRRLDDLFQSLLHRAFRGQL